MRNVSAGDSVADLGLGSLEGTDRLVHWGNELEEEQYSPENALEIVCSDLRTLVTLIKPLIT